MSAVLIRAVLHMPMLTMQLACQAFFALFTLHEAKCVQEADEQGLYPRRESRPETTLIRVGQIPYHARLWPEDAGTCSVHVRREAAK